MKKIIPVIVLVVVLVTLIFVATYAYFATSTTVNNLPVSASTASGSFVFDTYRVDDIDLDFSGGSMQESTSSIDLPMGTDTGELQISLLGVSDESELVCSYDLMFTWVSEKKFEESHLPLPYVKDGKTYNYEFSLQGETSDGAQSLDEVDFGSLNWTDDSALLGNYTISSSSTKVPTVISWNFTANWYNIPADQKDYAEETLSGYISVKNISCDI